MTFKIIKMFLSSKIYVVVCFSSMLFAAAVDTETSNNLKLKLSDYIFDTPDVIREYIREDGVKIRLDAYRTKNNDKLLETNQHSGLRWLSLGQPEVVEISENITFGFNKLLFWLQFEMLTIQDKKELADEVGRAKKIFVEPSQFSDINANSIECYIELYDVNELKTNILKGKVVNLNKSPYKINFKYPVGTKKRKLFDNEFKTEPNFEIVCTVTAGAQIKKSNTFTITLQESNNIQLRDKLFGPATECYVTRNQLFELSNEVNTYFNVVEDYQITEEQFRSTFVENLISLSSKTSFEPVSFNNALQILSKYSIDIKNDLNPTQITKELSEVFKIENRANKSRIIFDEKYFKALEKQSSSNGAGSVSAKIFSIGGGSAAASFAKSQSDHWVENRISLDDQLINLNTHLENKMTYKFEGNKIVPKTLEVSKLQSSAFKKTIFFSRIKNFYYDADYKQEFSLNTQNKKKEINQFQLEIKKEIVQMKEKVDGFEKNQKNQIKMLVSEDMLDLFDSDGKGKGEMKGWYLCDGRNGTPDLRGRFLVGKDEKEFEKVGKTGGSSRVKLTLEQIPSHSHPHTHEISLHTNQAGEHIYGYQDIFYSDSFRRIFKQSNIEVSVPLGSGSGRSNKNNEGHQMRRESESNGHHTHNVYGTSGVASSATGGNQEHENCPPFYVVQYIIFLAK